MAIVEAEVIPLPRQIAGRRRPYPPAATCDQHLLVHGRSLFLVSRLSSRPGYYPILGGNAWPHPPVFGNKEPALGSNAVHLSGAALRSTGKRVFDIFTALGLDGLGRFSMNMTPMQPRNSANLRGVWAGDNAPAITAIWFAMN